MEEDARISVAQTNSNGDVTDPISIAVFQEIVDTLAWERQDGQTLSPFEMFKTPVARRRVMLGTSAAVFSCIVGNIISSYYLGDELATAGITDATEQLEAVSSPTP